MEYMLQTKSKEKIYSKSLFWSWLMASKSGVGWGGGTEKRRFRWGPGLTHTNLLWRWFLSTLPAVLGRIHAQPSRELMICYRFCFIYFLAAFLLNSSGKLTFSVSLRFERALGRWIIVHSQENLPGYGRGIINNGRVAWLGTSHTAWNADHRNRPFVWKWAVRFFLWKLFNRCSWVIHL